MRSEEKKDMFRERSGYSKRRDHGEDQFLDKTVASKLFSFLLDDVEDCRMELHNVAEHLQRLISAHRRIHERDALRFINFFHKMFKSVKTADGRHFVEVKTTARLCDAFQETTCKVFSCRKLHICRFFLLGTCMFGDECKKPHSFDHPKTRELLQGHELINLSPDALKKLFKKVLSENMIKHASTTSGPKLCKFYNKGECKSGDKCKFLHVCQHYIDGDCKFGGWRSRCKRPHDFGSSHSRKLLEFHGFGHLRNDDEILSFLRSKADPADLGMEFHADLGSSCRKHGRQSETEKDYGATSAYVRDSYTTPEKKRRTSKVTLSSEVKEKTTISADEKLEICGFNLRGKCQYGDICNARHSSLPYEWQYAYSSQRSPSKWGSFTQVENRKIEKSFCSCDEDFARTFSRSRMLPLSIDFQSMTGIVEDCGDNNTGSNQGLLIRRLSTVSSVHAASGHVFRTKWEWYWKDEHDKWQSYDNGKSDTSSEKIEKDYMETLFRLDSSDKKHIFSTSSHKYTLYFDNPKQFYQQNDNVGTKRDVRRRPAKFLDEEAMKQILQEYKTNCRRTSFTCSNKNETVCSVPPNWAPLDPADEFKVVDLNEVVDSTEFTMVRKQFLETMSGFTVTSIKRVQNLELWEDYEKQKSRLAKKNSGNPPEERFLFHGTSKATVDPICQQGFDWRLSGKHGVMYGKGSYFATQASYSHTYSTQNYSGLGNNFRMFLAKVIVGSYVVGNSGTQRPPAKNNLDPLSPLYDSCVDNVSKPTIFVVFDHNQAYPNYIIDYKR